MITHLLNRPAYEPAANDDFDTDTGMWTTSAATIGGGVAQTDPAAPGNSWILSTWYLQGDFDIEAEYTCSDPGYLSSATIGMNALRYSDNNCIADVRQTTNAIGSDVKSWYGYDGCGTTPFINGIASPTESQIAGTARIRMVRVGDRIDAYVKYDQQSGWPDNSWYHLGYDDAFGAGLTGGIDTSIRLIAKSLTPGSPTFTCAWNYFKVNSADNIVYA